MLAFSAAAYANNSAACLGKIAPGFNVTYEVGDRTGDLGLPYARVLSL